MCVYLVNLVSCLASIRLDDCRSFCSQCNIFSDEFCEEYPHNLIPTPGYWIECSRQKITTDTIWDESESEHDSGPDRDDSGM